MSIINLLDKKVYNRISAGEVVERPASVVKELVENSVDASATEIMVTIERGGTTLVSVTDNGSGIDKSQLARAFMPHATSKIEKAEDLDEITSLGFRGEALASIGAVSRATIISKTESQEVGMAIDCFGGEISEVYPYPTMTGTTVICKDLFFNTPVREKFLKSVKGEESEVVGVIQRMALSQPNISFTLKCDGKNKIETFGGGLKECLSCVYDAKTLENCFMIEGNKNGIIVSGFVGKLSFTKPTRMYQTLIVNGRYVVDNTVSSAVANAYGGYLMKRQYPFYVLNLTIPPEAVDVNVHPRKAEVRFSNNQIVYSAVYSTISKVLDGTASALEIIKEDGKDGAFDSFSYREEGNPDKNSLKNYTFKPGEQVGVSYIGAELNENKERENLIKSDSEKEFDNIVKNSINSSENFGFSGNKSGFSYADNNVVSFNDSGKNGDNKEENYLENDYDFGKDSPFEEANQDKKEGIDIFAENKKYIEKLERERELKSIAYKQQEIEVEQPMVFVGQAFDTYLIFEKGDELYLIDQHAAHERLLYDGLCEKVKQGRVQSQPLLLPYTFNASGEDFQSIYSRFEYFRALGIDITNVGDDTFKVSAVPCDLCEINLKNFFDDLLFDNSFKRETIPLTLNEKLMQTACKHAIKGGDKLTKGDIDGIMAKINGNFGLRCPHGRPIAVKVTRQEIEKWFKRIV